MIFFRKLFGLVSLSSLAFASSAYGQIGSEPQPIDIPSQPLGAAIGEFVKETGVQVSVDTRLIEGSQSAAVKGVMTPSQSLDRMLTGTGLSANSLGSDGFVLRGQFALEAEEDTLLDEVVIVTTRRAEEALNDVPQSVVVLGEDFIDQSDIDDASEVFNNIPNVSFIGGSNPGFIQPSVRGASNLVGDGATSPAVGVFVDGQIINPTSLLGGIGSQANTLDLERVETVLGPQNNNFGRGTIGGAVNFVTKKPTDEVELVVDGEIGSFPDGKGSIVLNTPIIRDGLLSARLVGFGSASDGFVDFLTGQPKDSIGFSDGGFRLNLRSRPTDRLTIDGSVSFDRSQFDTSNIATLASIDAGDPVFDGAFVDENQVDRLRGNITISQEFDSGRLNLKGSFFSSDNDFPNDTDLTSFDLVTTFLTQENQIVSGEARFDSRKFNLPKTLGQIAFNTGVSIGFTEFSSSSVIDPGTIFIPPATLLTLPDGFDITLNSDQEVLTFGVFGELRWQPIEQLEIAGGLRYNLDDVTQTGETINTIPPIGLPLPVGVPLTLGEETFTALTPSASIKYDWTDRLSTYFSFSTGFRAGGFNITTTSLDSFEEEFSLQYEGGVRASLFDDRVAITASGFFLDRNDVQATALELIDGIFQPVIGNAEEARAIGGEIGILVKPISGLTLDTKWGLNFTEFTEFTSGPDFDGDGLPDDLTGLDLPNAPEHTLSIVGDYQHPEALFGSAFPFVRAEFNLRTSFDSGIGDPDDVDFTLSGFEILNFRAGLRADNYQLEGFVENALNEVYGTNIVLPVFGGAEPNAAVGPTRRFGVRGRVIF